MKSNKAKEGLDPRSFTSLPNLITLFRLSASLTFFTLAALKSSPDLNFIGLGLHWAGDVMDGFLARKTKQETILGAEIDIIADRIESIFFYLNFLNFNPHLFLPIIIYLIDFAFVDFYLSYQFIKYPIISPNYFYLVDQRVYRYNFSPLAKFCNSTVVALLLIFVPQWSILAVLFASGLIILKLRSIFWLREKT
ncbi:MAG: CDP-alcohol phosphatidyltransferase family protein [Candidatus Aminicenantes bacterium]|nr:CDP-alcohol phosphatidyltransferase family protein [Candidatus Aminicenantes bacterium]